MTTEDYFNRIRQNLYFVLVEPESPGNVGAAARALKTSGFPKLILINPPAVESPETKMMAHRSFDIIRRAKIVTTFNEAVENMHLTVGTTMRKRHSNFPIFGPLELTRKILPIALRHPVALVFGRERTGLTNEELFKCQWHSTIPTAAQNPSLNLAQAVMLYAHTFFMQARQPRANQYILDLATQYEQEKFYAHLSAALQEVHFLPRDGMDDFLIRIRRFMGRALPEKRDVRLLHKLIQIFETRIRDLEEQNPGLKKRNIY